MAIGGIHDNYQIETERKAVWSHGIPKRENDFILDLLAVASIQVGESCPSERVNCIREACFYGRDFPIHQKQDVHAGRGSDSPPRRHGRAAHESVAQTQGVQTARCCLNDGQNYFVGHDSVDSIQ
jgi:hypothetical protein